MFKSLAFCTFLVLWLSCAGVAQTANYLDNPRNRVVERPASPEAKAEAKRLYKEGVKYGLAGLYQQAIEILQRSIKLDPENADAGEAAVVAEPQDGELGRTLVIAVAGDEDAIARD